MTLEKTSPEAKTKLKKYLEIAASIDLLVNRIVSEGSARLQTESQDVTLRDRVLIGLAIKGYKSFEALVEDAKSMRAEAFHHLKTLAETFFYFHWVGQETEEKRAKLLMATATHYKMVFIKNNPGYFNQRETQFWAAAHQAWIQGLEDEWKKFERNLYKLTGDVSQELRGWYNGVYRLACEPAHVGDLPEYVPLPKEPLALTRTKFEVLRALMALDHGVQIMCDLLKNLSEIYELGLSEAIVQLKAEADNTRMLSV